MSGVNRNILQNGGIPLAGRGQTNIDLQTTSGSRFVIMNFPPTFLSSSNGGTCNGITLQWTPDSSLGFETSSVYYAVTQSTLNCEPYSLSPMTSSLGYTQFIDSQYNTSAPTYYMRAYQNFVGGGKGPYSDIVSIQTRPAVYCNAPATSQYGGVGGRSLQVLFDVDGWNPNGNYWYSNQGSGSGAAFTASISGTPQLVKVGGPNYDAIKTNGGTITVDLKGSNVNQGGGTAQTIYLSLGLASGSATFNLAGGMNSFKVTATDSTAVNDVQVSIPTGTVGNFPTGVNTRNKVIGLQIAANGNFTVDGAVTGSVTTISTQINISSLTISTSADCVIREFNIGNASYDPTIYHCKYGN